MNDRMFEMDLRLLGCAIALLILAALSIGTALPSRVLPAERVSPAAPLSTEEVVVAAEDTVWLQV